MNAPGGPGDKGKKKTSKKVQYDSSKGGWMYDLEGKPIRELTDSEKKRFRKEFKDKIPAGQEVSVASTGGKTNSFGTGYGLYTGSYTPKTQPPSPPKKQGPIEIGKLSIKPSSSMSATTKKSGLIKPKNEMEVSAAIAKPTKKSVPKKDSSLFIATERKQRKNPNAASPFSKNKYYKTSKKLMYTGQSEENKAARKSARAENRSTLGARLGYKKEEKLASAYEKNKGIFDGETKREMKSAIKSYKTFKKTAGEKLDKSQKQAVKTGRTAAKYVGKLEKGKIKTFTPQALSAKTTVGTQYTVQKEGRKANVKGDVIGSTSLPGKRVGVTSTTKKGKMQAGKMRY